MSSDVEGTFPGEGSYQEGGYAFSTNSLLQVATHEVQLNVVGSGGTNAEDSVTIQVVENMPPSISIEIPTEEDNVLNLGEDIEIMVQVLDEYEDLDPLPFIWTLYGP